MTAMDSAMPTGQGTRLGWRPIRLFTEDVLARLLSLSPEDQADYKLLEQEYHRAESQADKREILQAMLEIVLDEPAEGISIEAVEREARSTLEGAAAADRFEREARAFGRNVKRLRGKSGLTQSDLADKANMTQPQISYLERGEHRPQEGTVKKLAEALGVSPDELLPLD